MIERLQYFPVTLFASVMGIAGVALAWRRAARVWRIPEWPYQAWFWLALGVFVFLALLYLVKAFRHPEALREEWHHPIRLAFIPTITIGLILLATAGQDIMPPVASVLWWVGAVGHLLLTVAVISAWFRRGGVQLGQVTPAWFIPIVGNVITPLAAPQVGNLELGWFSFGTGLVFWVAFLPILLHRVVLHDQPLPTKLVPSLAIFIAPPAVAMLSWQSLTGGLADPFSMVLYSAAALFALLLFAQVGHLRTIPFALSYWAYAFPVAALATASIALGSARQQPVYSAIGLALLVLATLLVIGIAALTLRAALGGKILIPE
nr:C4-dicarboxylate ABC transporter [Propionibacterium sp.]